MDRRAQKRKSLPERRNFREKSLPDILNRKDLYCEAEDDTHSAPSSRSSSRSNSFRSKAIPEVERVYSDYDNQRRNSEPNSPHPMLLAVPHDPLVKVRSFKTTSKGVVSRGDSFRRASDGKNPPISHSKSDNAIYQSSKDADENKNGLLATSSRAPDTPCNNCYKVAVIGADGVGKTALTQQFLTSENNFFNDSPTGHVDVPNQITVVIDREETTVEFVDTEEKMDISICSACDAFIIVYSVQDVNSFNYARHRLHTLRHIIETDRVCILVANKVDLVRKRRVKTDDGRAVAQKYDCKYIETSAGLNLKVDELLVGIVRQIKLKLKLDLERKTLPRTQKQSLPTKQQKGFFKRLFRRRPEKKTSCSNMQKL